MLKWLMKWLLTWRRDLRRDLLLHCWTLHTLGLASPDSHQGAESLLLEVIPIVKGVIPHLTRQVLAVHCPLVLLLGHEIAHLVGSGPPVADVIGHGLEGVIHALASCNLAAPRLRSGSLHPPSCHRRRPRGWPHV